MRHTTQKVKEKLDGYSFLAFVNGMAQNPILTKQRLSEMINTASDGEVSFGVVVSDSMSKIELCFEFIRLVATDERFATLDEAIDHYLIECCIK